MSDHALRLLRQDRRLAEPAAFPFDFDLNAEERCAYDRLGSEGPQL
ncbi:hypothetical protein ACFSUJ_29375 [Streptomyces lusitanus]|uniref:Uncharacterized protein n=1 Tax=Streptomyces lusitanus TaxID=68232 RepID=A0ABU3JQ08_9ACTN|nr:hypothetical protein [Streptomyces lusitanus]